MNLQHLRHGYGIIGDWLIKRCASTWSGLCLFVIIQQGLCGESIDNKPSLGQGKQKSKNY